jgi:hypothetical protein
MAENGFFSCASFERRTMSAEADDYHKHLLDNELRHRAATRRTWHCVVLFFKTQHIVLICLSAEENYANLSLDVA